MFWKGETIAGDQARKLVKDLRRLLSPNAREEIFQVR